MKAAAQVLGKQAAHDLVHKNPLAIISSKVAAVA
jgi:hypothetical protein